VEAHRVIRRRGRHIFLIVGSKVAVRLSASRARRPLHQGRFLILLSAESYLYWVIGRKSPASLESKLLLYQTIIKSIWTYGIELWGCASKSHIAKMQRSQSKILRMIKNAPWYVTNQTLYYDLKVPFIKDVILEKSINHHDKLGNHSNPILQPLLEQQQRRLQKLWPTDLIDG
jgi:hypothetical protein